MAPRRAFVLYKSARRFLHKKLNKAEVEIGYAKASSRRRVCKKINDRLRTLLARTADNSEFKRYLAPHTKKGRFLPSFSWWWS